MTAGGDTSVSCAMGKRQGQAHLNQIIMLIAKPPQWRRSRGFVHPTQAVTQEPHDDSTRHFCRVFTDKSTIRSISVLFLVIGSVSRPFTIDSRPRTGYRSHCMKYFGFSFGGVSAISSGHHLKWIYRSVLRVSSCDSVTCHSLHGYAPLGTNSRDQFPGVDHAFG